MRTRRAWRRRDYSQRAIRLLANAALVLQLHLYQRHQTLTGKVHSRVAMEVMRSGWSIRLFQAAQQASTMAS